MTRKRRRMVVLSLGMLCLSIGVGLLLLALRSNLDAFYSPSQLTGNPIEPGRRFRIGGLVETGSVHRIDATTIDFRVTDLKSDIKVTYSGLLPDLFREGQGVMALGVLTSDGVFTASEILAKHDERYMPPEVAAALKKNGEWRGTNAEMVP